MQWLGALSAPPTSESCFWRRTCCCGAQHCRFLTCCFWVYVVRARLGSSDPRWVLGRGSHKALQNVLTRVLRRCLLVGLKGKRVLGRGSSERGDLPEGAQNALLEYDSPRRMPYTSALSGPISRQVAIISLHYPISRDTFSGRLARSQSGAIPPPPPST